MLRSLAIITIALFLGTATTARAEEAEASPKNYVVGAVATTLFYQPNTGSSSGWQHDISTTLGYGRYISETIALELDLGPTYTRGEYSLFFLLPGVVWNFSTHIYTAARFVVPLDPEVNFALFPGLGAIYTFKNDISISLEMNVLSTIGRGKPDLGLSLSPGIAYSF